VFTDPEDFKHADGKTSGSETTRAEHSAASDGKPPAGETWVALCAQAAVEQDPKRLLALVSEINRLLDARKKRLTHGSGGKAPER